MRGEEYIDPSLQQFNAHRLHDQAAKALRFEEAACPPQKIQRAAQPRRKYVLASQTSPDRFAFIDTGSIRLGHKMVCVEDAGGGADHKVRSPPQLGRSPQAR